MENYLLIGAVIAASIGALTDVRSARIPNLLTYTSLSAALGFRFALLGTTGLVSGLTGALAAGAFFFLLFLLGAMGGGDLKLMAAIGAWVGSAQVVNVLLVSFLAGGVLAVVYMIFGQRVRQTLRNTLELISFNLSGGGLQRHPVLNVQESGSMRVPFGVAIAIATLYCAGNAFWRR